MSSAGITAVGDIITLLEDNWTSANTDNKTPTFSDNLRKAWEDVTTGTSDYLYVKYDTERVKTGLYAADFFHTVALSIEVIVPAFGNTADATHFRRVLQEVARIIKANARNTGYAYTLMRGSTARFNRDRNLYVGSIDVDVMKVLTS